MVEINPRTTLVSIEGRDVPVAEVAHAWDQVRLNKMAFDPVPMLDVTVSRATKAGEAFQVVGHAAVFNRRSLDLGGFAEKIAPHAFDNVLDRDPDVHAVWNHDMTKVLARTRNHTLELSVTPRGLRNWMQVAPTSYANDLRVLMERGDIDQQSFTFTIADESWELDTDGMPTRTVLEVGDLYDVTVAAQGAYPQTASQVVRSFLAIDRKVFAVPELKATPPTGDEVEDRSGAPDEVATVEDVAQADPAGDPVAAARVEAVAEPDEHAERLELVQARLVERKAALRDLRKRVEQL